MPANVPAKKKTRTGPAAAKQVPQNDVIDVNAAWAAKRQLWLENIALKFGQDICTSPPVAGHIDPFTQEAYTEFLDRDGNNAVADKELYFTAGCNVMAIDHSVSMTPHVPVSESKVAMLKDHIQPRSFTSTIDVAVTWSKRTKTVPWGKLIRISPEQQTDALLWKFSDRLDDEKISDEEKEAWKQTLLCVTCRYFCRLDNLDKRYYHQLFFREQARTVSAAVAFSTLGMICDVWSFKVRKEKEKQGNISALELSKMYGEHVVFSGDSEPRSQGIIDACITAYRRLMLIPELRSILLRLEELPEGSPLDSAFKIDELIKKKTSKQLLWWLSKLEDDLNTKSRSKSEFTIKTIRSGHLNSITDMYMAKQQIKAHVLSSELDRRGRLIRSGSL